HRRAGDKGGSGQKTGRRKVISFSSDYMTGAHPKILERLSETNLVTEPGYGFDSFTLSAKEKIRCECGIPGAEVVFVSGGTQANLVVISTMLDSFSGVISPSTGHIAGHEAGAIEYSGHKVISVPSKKAPCLVQDGIHPASRPSLPQLHQGLGVCEPYE
ncbi:MAG: hypothetical protein II720_05840, partial [Bacteroidales bacterium]|nr:hypothetical protein [Bacteroidales bacterium]